ncbi:MAG: hypothetical protein L0I76_36915 [Pseudonocardia sp.]|nr:hypothetical protein [Pseudonocardia sp.]
MTTTDTTTDPAAFAAPEPPPAPGDAPTFGRRKEGTRPKRVSFVLVTYDARDAPTEHTLTARAAVDTASVFGFGRSGQNLGAQIAAIRNLLMRTLVDDDGIGIHEGTEQVAPAPDNPDTMVPVEGLDAADWSMSDLAWRTPDGAVHDTAEAAAAHTREHGSSLRRFTAIMDDDGLSVEQSALEEILDFLMTEAADRPTQRSSASSRSRPRKGR